MAKRLYNTKRWQMLRAEVLSQALYTCSHCKRSSTAKGTMVVDHIVRHKGNEARFWDRTNLQALCKLCHDKHKQSIEKGGSGRPAIGVDGWPVTG
jgi:5-methylcytosine-specific restriction endonuclease McrA